MGRVSWAGCHGPCVAKNVGVGRRMASVQCSAEILVDAPRILGQAWDTCGQTGPEERSPGHPVWGRSWAQASHLPRTPQGPHMPSSILILSIRIVSIITLGMYSRFWDTRFSPGGAWLWCGWADGALDPPPAIFSYFFLWAVLASRWGSYFDGGPTLMH